MKICGAERFDGQTCEVKIKNKEKYCETHDPDKMLVLFKEDANQLQLTYAGKNPVILGTAKYIEGKIYTLPKTEAEEYIKRGQAEKVDVGKLIKDLQKVVDKGHIQMKKAIANEDIAQFLPLSKKSKKFLKKKIKNKDFTKKEIDFLNKVMKIKCWIPFDYLDGLSISDIQKTFNRPVSEEETLKIKETIVRVAGILYQQFMDDITGGKFTKPAKKRN